MLLKQNGAYFCIALNAHCTICLVKLTRGHLVSLEAVSELKFYGEIIIRKCVESFSQAVSVPFVRSMNRWRSQKFCLGVQFDIFA